MSRKIGKKPLKFKCKECGKEQVCFWDNQTNLFLPNHSYLIVYHSDYRGLLLPIGADTIVSLKELNDTP